MSVIREVSEKRLRQGEAARRLSLSIRQVKRLVRALPGVGCFGVGVGTPRPAAEQRDRPRRCAVRRWVWFASATRISVRPSRARSWWRHTRFQAVGGDAARLDDRGRAVAAEGAAGVCKRTPSRPRRECLGDLVQIDGSPHDWFEERGPAVHPDQCTWTTRRRGCWRWGFGRRRRPRPTWRRRGRTWRPAGGRWRTTRTATACSG